MYIEEITIDAIDKFEFDSVFSSSAWIGIYDSERLELKGIFNKNNELIGFFYYQFHSRAKVLKQVSPPFLSPNCGLYYQDNTSNPAQKNTFRKKVLQLISTHLKGLKSTLISLPFPEGNEDMQPFIWDDFKVEPKYTYQINLEESQDEILSKMSSERRKNIKKAQKEGIKAQFSLKNEDSQKLIKETFLNQGLNFDEVVLDKIFNQFCNDNNSISFTSYIDDLPLATVFCVFDKNIAYYILGGYGKTNKHEGAGALAMWEAIKYAKSKGIKTFDFEGSMHPPIEKYFRGFGGKVVSFFVVKNENVLGKLLLKIRKK